MIQKSKFIPAKGLSNPHLQSIFPTLIRRHLKIKYRRERLELADGDFIDLEWLGKGEGPIVIILHGMAGSATSPYVKGIMQNIAARGWRGVLMYYRGCSGEPNRLQQTYHFGKTTDLNDVLNYLHSTHPNTKIFAAGYSMGANVLLKWLGETPQQTQLQAAVAVSAPYDLRSASAAIRHGTGRFYQWLLMRDLRRYINNKYQYPHAPIDLKSVTKIKSFWDLDEKVIAPLNGFNSAIDYYHRSSCGPWIKNIKTPTLIIHALDDPMIPMATIPSADELSESVVLELSQHGGHVGFVGGSFKNPIFWLDTHILDFFTPYLPAKVSNKNYLPIPHANNKRTACHKSA